MSEKVLNFQAFYSASKHNNHSRNNSDGGGGDDMWSQSLENRLNSMEYRVEQTRNHLWAGIALLLAAFAGGFLSLDTKIDSLSDRMDTKIAKVDDKLNDLNVNMDNKIDSLSNRMDTKFAKVDDKFAKLDDKLNDLNVNAAKMDGKLDAIIQKLDGKTKSAAKSD